MNYKKTITMLAVMATSLTAIAQTPNTEGVSISSGVTPPHPSAMLDVSSSNKGVLIPRMKFSDRGTIPTPIAEGLLIYQTDNTPGYYFYDGATWQPLGTGGSNTGFWQAGASNSIHYSNSGRVGIFTNGDAPRSSLDIKGDQSGIYMGGSIQNRGEDPLYPHYNTDLFLKLFTDSRHGLIESSFHGLLINWNQSQSSNLDDQNTPIVFCTPAYNMDGNYVLSDSTLKTNIQPLNSNISKINQLSPKSYKMVGKENGATHRGFLAQDIENILPDLVSIVKIPDSPDLKAINYIELIPILTGAIQEQQATITTLQATVNSLLERVQVLENQ